MNAPVCSWAAQIFIAGLALDALIAPWVINGVMGGPVFAVSVRKVLVPELVPGTVVILDNLATHRNVEAAEAGGVLVPLSSAILARPETH